MKTFFQQGSTNRRASHTLLAFSQVDIDKCFSQAEINKKQQAMVRMRRSSCHSLTLEVQELQKRQKMDGQSQKVRKEIDLLSNSTLPTVYATQKDVFVRAKLSNQLQTRYHGLSKQAHPLQASQVQRLDYVTFRMLKQKQKNSLKLLRESIIARKD